MAPGDYDQAYLEEIRDARFAPAYPIDAIEYEDWQPPLYYLLLTPVFLATGGSLIALRFTTVLIGAGIILLAGLIGVRLFPQRPWIGWSTAVFVAFIPQHVAMLASVNNDSLAELLIAAILFLLLPPPSSWSRRRIAALALLLGMGFLTKATVYLMAPVIGIALLLHHRTNWPALLRTGLQLFIPALLLGALWWTRNAVVYGDLDVLAKATHDAVVVGQPRTATWIADYGLWGTWRRFLQTTFNSFWGQFGWMAVPMPAWVYRPLLVLMLAAGSGLFLRGRRKDGRLLPTAAILLGLTFLLTAGVHIGYNLTFVQHQGRYLFPALIPITIAFSLGLDRWLHWIKRTLRFNQAWLPYLIPLGLGIGLAALDLYALYRFILPMLQLN